MGAPVRGAFCDDEAGGREVVTALSGFQGFHLEVARVTDTPILLPRVSPTDPPCSGKRVTLPHGREGRLRVWLNPNPRQQYLR